MREVIWEGHDPAFVQAMTNELGILLEADTATVSIVRIDHSVQMYEVLDGSTELTLIARPNKVEVRRKVKGALSDAIVDLSDLRANRVRLQCHALVDRIQAREMK
jgi:hypothetical protein